MTFGMDLDFQPLKSSLTHTGRQLPPLIYGTAEITGPATVLAALKAGYRALDCACQPQYYHEHVVGAAITEALRPISQGGLGLERTDLYIQTKFTTLAGHTSDKAPYTSDDPTRLRVEKSLNMSLSKLGLDRVDALLLHGPLPTMAETLETWKAMESFVGDAVGELGVCNVTLEQLQTVWGDATIRPSIVQNRFWSRNDYDKDVRVFCSDHDIVYQAFWVLKANPHLLDSSLVGWLADRSGQTRQDVLYTLVLGLGRDASGVCVLNGTTREERMKSSLATISHLGLAPKMVREAFLAELCLEQKAV